MPSLYSSENLVKLLLLFIGTALVLMGFYGVVLDFVHDWKIEEYSSLVAVLCGSAILLATIMIYVVIPEYHGRQRIEQIRHYYIGKPEGEAKDIKHNIMERSQGIMVGVDLLAESVRECVSKDSTYKVCIEKIATSKDILEHINSESNKLKDYLTQLENYVKSKKDKEAMSK